MDYFKTFQAKVVFLSLAIATMIIFIVAAIFSQIQKGAETRQIFNHLRGAIYSGVIYDSAGDAKLDTLLQNASISVDCEFNPTFSFGRGNLTAVQTSETALANCHPSSRYLEMPIYGAFSHRYPNLHSISIFNESGEIVKAIPNAARPYLQSINEDLNLLLDWNIPTEEIDIAETFAYRLNPEALLVNPRNDLVIYALPIFNSEKSHVLGSVVLQIEPQNQGAFSLAAGLLLWLLPLTAVVSLLLSHLISNQIAARVATLQKAVNHWEDGDFTYRIPVIPDDEVGKLSHDLNKMAAQLGTVIDTNTMIAKIDARQKLARDLHDAAKQQLFAASMQLTAVQAHLPTNVTTAEIHLSKAQKLIKQAQQELGTVIQALRPIPLQQHPFHTAVQQMVAEFNDQSEISFTLKQSGTKQISMNVEQEIFRILHELLSNIAQHSKATAAHITLDTNQQVKLKVSDNGQGFTTDHIKSGFGLESIQQRAWSLNGTYHIQSQQNQGTTTIITIPYNQTAALTQSKDEKHD